MARVVHVTTTDISLSLLLGPQLQAFAAAGHEVIGASAPGPFVGDLGRIGIRHHALRHATRRVSVRHDALAVPELVRLFRRLRPAIVHTHNPKPGVYGRVAARAAGVPVVVNTVHGLYADREDPLRRRAVVYGLERLAATCSDAELVQNREDLATLAALGVPSSRLHLLGNGIDLARFGSGAGTRESRATLRARWGVDDHTVVIGAVGRLVWEKGYAELFAAAEALHRQGTPARVVVAGPLDPDKADGIGPSEVAAAEAAGVTFLGYQERIEDVYAAFDIYALASHREGFPRSAMEAAAMGLPIVATDIRGCREVVDHDVTGLLVPRRDPVALGAALQRLATDGPARAAMGRRAREKARSQFDQQRVIDITLDVYDRLLRRPRSRTPAWSRGRGEPPPAR